MSAEDSKNLNLRWVQAFNEQDWATEASCRTDDYMAHMQGAPGPLDGSRWGEFMSLFANAFPDVHITVETSISEGDLVASRWTMKGTHRGEFMGVPPTGKPITMKGIDFSRVVDGKMAEHWAQFDVIGVMQQIGAMPTQA